MVQLRVAAEKYPEAKDALMAEDQKIHDEFMEKVRQAEEARKEAEEKQKQDSQQS